MYYLSNYYGVVGFGDVVQHHGVKGQKWGVRNYQYIDGSLTPAGKIHYGYGANKSTSNKTHVNAKNAVAKMLLEHYSNVKMRDAARGSGVGKKYVDTYLNINTPLYRIQSSSEFENYAFYATHEKHDVDEYAGLFGKNLMSRANAEAASAEKEAKISGDYESAKALRDKADNMQVYQLKLNTTKRLKVPSEENAAHIVGKLLTDKEFHTDLRGAIADSASKMKRPGQQVLFKEAAKLLTKDPSKLSSSDKRVIYRALNLSLTNHNEQEVRMQNKFYDAMKKNGYSALLDLNDKTYSSYHAHNPVIVFDTDKVALQAVSSMNPKKIETLYKKHNRERIIKDIPEQIVGTLAKTGDIKLSQISSYSVQKMLDYYND